MTATPVRTSKTAAAVAERPALSSVPRHFVEPPAALNPTVGLFLGGYALAALTIWGWFVGQWPLPLLVLIGFLALHLEGTVIHDACHNAAHPNRFWNAVMGHGAARFRVVVVRVIPPPYTTQNRERLQALARISPFYVKGE